MRFIHRFWKNRHIQIAMSERKIIYSIPLEQESGKIVSIEPPIFGDKGIVITAIVEPFGNQTNLDSSISKTDCLVIREGYSKTQELK